MSATDTVVDDAAESLRVGVDPPERTLLQRNCSLCWRGALPFVSKFTCAGCGSRQTMDEPDRFSPPAYARPAVQRPTSRSKAATSLLYS